MRDPDEARGDWGEGGLVAPHSIIAKMDRRVGHASILRAGGAGKEGHEESSSCMATTMVLNKPTFCASPRTARNACAAVVALL